MGITGTNRFYSYFSQRLASVILFCFTISASFGPAYADGQVTASKISFRGIVLTTNDVPIPKATVTIKSAYAGRGVVNVYDAPDCGRQVVSKTDGTFAFEGLAAKKFDGTVSASGYELQSFWQAESSAKPLEIKMSPAPPDDPEQMVKGRVVDAQGQPVPGAEVQVSFVHTPKDWHSGGGVVYADDHGKFVFQAREKILDCDFTIYASGFVAQSFSEVKPGLITNTYVLSRGVRLTGRLLKDGQPVADAGIGISCAGSGQNNLAVVTEENGKFVFSGVPPHQKIYLFGIMRSLRELGALRRQIIQIGDEGTVIELGDLNLSKGYTIAGRIQMTGGKPTRVAAFTLVRTELTPPTDHTPSSKEESNRSFYGLEHSFDSWRADPGADGRFEFTGVPDETVSLCLMLRPFDMLSSRNVSSDGKGFRLLGLVVSNKTDLILELEPHTGQMFPAARNFETLSHQPLRGAEAALAK